MSTPRVLAHPRLAPLDWEEIACPLCGESDEVELLTAPAPESNDLTRYRLVQCRSCGMGYVNPRPTPRALERFYPADYRPYRTRVRQSSIGKSVKKYLETQVLRTCLGYPPERVRPWERLLGRLAASWVGPSRDSHTSIPWHGQGRLLDFGCGSGWFAERMSERGWQVTGLDVSPQVAADVRQRLGIPVHVGTLPHPALAPNSFDVVNMGAVLEHVPHPHEVIGAARAALKPGGLLVISVPNRDSWSFRHAGAAWFSLDLPRHLLHFTPATLRRLVEEHGFEVCEERQLARVSWMRRTLAQRAGSRDRLLRRAPLVGLWTRWTCWTRQADCLFLMAQKRGTLRPTPA